MEIRTFYWKARIIPPLAHSFLKLTRFRASFYFSTGNCGDIYNEKLIHHVYGKNVKIENTPKEGRRLLLVGSISHNIQDHDVLCGTGSKSAHIPKRKKDIKILGLRGPLSYDAFKNAGYNMNNIKYLYDLGLLIGEIIPKDIIKKNNPSGVIFIPHYRERFTYDSLPKGITFCDIDNTPEYIAQRILNAELVYTSSLHGIIFAHALGRRAVFVAPKTEEPEFKYKDYYASVALPYQRPLKSIYDANFIKDDKLPFDISFNRNDIILPSKKELEDIGVINYSAKKCCKQK